MITGSSSSNNYTSGEIFSNLMALAAVPTAVAAHTRFQCSTIRFEQKQQSVIKTNQELRPKDLLYFIVDQELVAA